MTYFNWKARGLNHVKYKSLNLDARYPDQPLKINWRHDELTIFNFQETNGNSLFHISVYHDMLLKLIRRTLKVSLTESWHFIKDASFCNVPQLYLIQPQKVHLTYPCHKIEFSSEHTFDKLWTITVSHKFSIQFTIQQAYIPFDQGCKFSFIAAYNNHTGHKNNVTNELIDLFCGHVEMESFYSKYNKATVRFVSSTVNTNRIPYIYAQYTVIIHGTAYKHNHRLLHAHYKLKIRSFSYVRPQHQHIFTALPHPQIIFYNSHLVFIWHIVTRDLSTFKDLKYYNIGIQPHFTLYFKRFTCHGNISADLHIFPGLLSLYTMQYEARGHHISCRHMKYNSVYSPLKEHLYATLALVTMPYHYPSVVIIVKINKHIGGKWEIGHPSIKKIREKLSQLSPGVAVPMSGYIYKGYLKFTHLSNTDDMQKTVNFRHSEVSITSEEHMHGLYLLP